MIETELMKQALSQRGEASQLDMVIEECAELINAIQKRRRGRNSVRDVVEEGVDVELCLEQLKLMFNDPVLWASIRRQKLLRLANLLTSESPIE